MPTPTILINLISERIGQTLLIIILPKNKSYSLPALLHPWDEGLKQQTVLMTAALVYLVGCF